MSVTSIDYTFLFKAADYGLEGAVAALTPRGQDPQAAHLIHADFSDPACGKKLHLGSSRGLWFLRVDTEVGSVSVCPQLESLTVIGEQSGSSQDVSFRDATTLTELDARLQEDKFFFPLQIGFLEALHHVLPQLEVDSYLEFELLGEPTGDGALTREERQRRRRITARKQEWQFREHWHLATYLDRLRVCEEEASWWEVWWHAWSLGKSLVQCAEVSEPASWGQQQKETPVVCITPVGRRLDA